MSAVTVLFERTSVAELGKADWILAMTVRQGHGLGADYLTVDLDESMEAVPPQYAATRSASFSLSLSGISASAGMSQSTYTVAPGLRSITIPVQRALFGTKLVELRFQFRWKNALLIPHRIKLSLTIHYQGLCIFHRQVEGHYLKFRDGIAQRLTDFLERARGATFLFPREDAPVELDYAAFSPMVSRIQSYPETTVWGTTWPSEVPFWRSHHGQEYLARQIIARRRDSTQFSRRLAVCPYSLGLNTDVCNDFLEELEIQARCGVSIRMLEAGGILEAIGNNQDALLTFGRSIGVIYRGLQPDQEDAKASLSLVLRTEAIGAIHAKYVEILARGATWDDYKNRRRVFFGFEALDRIGDRVVSVNLRALSLSRN